MGNIWHLFLLTTETQSQTAFFSMNDSNNIVYPLFRIEREKPNAKRTGRLSLSKSKSTKVIRENAETTSDMKPLPDIAVSDLPPQNSSFCLTMPIISHSPDSSPYSSAHSDSCTDEEIVLDIECDKKTFCSGNIEEKNSLPTGADGLPVAVHFEPFDTDDGKVYRVREAEALPLLDDSEYKFLDDYDPIIIMPGFSYKQTTLTSVPAACPLDIHDEYCGKYAKHSKLNCWEAQPWLMPLNLIKLRAADEYASNFGRKDEDKSFRWHDIFLRKSEGAEMDALDIKRDELAAYEEKVLQQGADNREQNEKLKNWEEKLREKYLPQHSRFPQVTRLRTEHQEVDVESMVDAYTDKVFEQYSSTKDFLPNKMPESVMQKDEDIIILMRFNDNEDETQVIKKVGFSLGDTDDCHHDVKVKFVPPFVPKKEYFIVP